MKASKSFISAIALASAAFVSPMALADDISNPVETIALDTDGTAFFGALFTGGNADATFTDMYTFTTTSVGDLSAGLTSLSGNANNGLDITGYSLWSAGSLLLSGTQLSTGQVDEWSLTMSSLAAGEYTVQVTGSMMSNSAGKYYANVALAPVPEPETYAMMLGGLGLLGFTLRRRNKKAAALPA